MVTDYISYHGFYLSHCCFGRRNSDIRCSVAEGLVDVSRHGRVWELAV